MIIYNSNLHLNQKNKVMKNYEEIENLQSRISASLADELAGLTTPWIECNDCFRFNILLHVIRKLNKLVKTKIYCKII